MDSSMISAFVGAITGGLIALLGVFWTHHLSTKAAIKSNREEEREFLISIQDDISCLSHIYNQSVGKNLEALDKNEGAFLNYIAAQDYFAFYHGNITELKKVKSFYIRIQINHTYTLIKSLLDSWAINSKLNSDYEESIKYQSEETQNRHKKLVNEYAEPLREIHDQVLLRINQLNKLIDHELNTKYLKDGSNLRIYKAILIITLCLLIAA